MKYEFSHAFISNWFIDNMFFTCCDFSKAFLSERVFKLYLTYIFNSHILKVCYQVIKVLVSVLFGAL